MLNELPETEVENLCNILYKEWPQTIQAMGVLRTCSEWRKKKPNLDIQIFYHEKNIQSGVFILTYKSGCNIPVLFLYALDTYENELEEIFSHFLDKCDETVGQSLVSKKHFPIVEKVIAAKAYKVDLTNCVVFSIDLDRATNVEINYPLDVEVKPLRKEHVKNIYENQPESVQYVFNMEGFENRLELDSEFAVGVFCKKTGRLLSRCMRSHDGSICSLHTVKEARRKGYAKLLLKHVSTKLAELSIIPYLLTDARNEEGMRVVQTSGFHVVTHVVCAVIGKSAASTPLKANECRSANE